MASKAEYHYKKAKAILKRLEGEAHMTTKKDEHARLMDVADKHMELYRGFRAEEMQPTPGPYPSYPRQWGNPGWTTTYGSTTLTNTNTDDGFVAEGNVVE